MSQKSEKIPTVTVLNPIRPEHARSGEPLLSYPNLGKAVLKHAPYESMRWQEFIDAQEGSIDEAKKAEALAKQYLLLTAHQLTQAETSENKELWTKRFTEASIELHGEPDPEIAKGLLLQQQKEFEDLQGNPNVSQSQLQWLLKKYDELGIQESTELKNTNEVIEKASKTITDILRTRFSSAIEVFEEGEGDDKINPEEIASLFNQALDILKEKDEAWQEWEIEVTDDSNLSRVKQKIKVGKNRLPATKKELAGLFAHEVLIHGLRAVNGKKLSDELRTGLPGYLAAEEGIALLAEYGLNGDMPPKLIDRYVDIALALGQITDEPIARKNLFVFASARNIIRMQASRTQEDTATDSDGTKQQNQAQAVQTQALQHINRIYRGSLGNEYIGVFTKDAEYYEGITIMSNYISEKLDEGKTSEEIFDYIMLGKFDPTNKKHEKYVKSVVG